MKKLFTFLLITLGSLYLNAQTVDFGLTAGYLNGTAKVDDGSYGSISNSESGFYVGALMDIAIEDNFYLQPGVTYGNINDSSILYIPFLAKYYIAQSGFHLLGGPQVTFDLQEAPPGYDSFGLDASFGAGYDITENFFLNARYAFELTNRLNDGPDDVKLRINSLLIGLGYKF